MRVILQCHLTRVVRGSVNVGVFKRRATMFCESFLDSVGLLSVDLRVFSAAPCSTAYFENIFQRSVHRTKIFLRCSFSIGFEDRLHSLFNHAARYSTQDIFLIPNHGGIDHALIYNCAK